VPNLAEGLLAIVAGRERAAALYGDLLELAQSHGRAWFVAAYIRTLFSLTWRLVLALFVADIGRQMMFDAAKLYFHATPPSWRTTHSPYLLGQMGPLLACVMSTLWFALPFAAVRYGVRDRFVRLTFAIAAGTTVGSRWGARWRRWGSPWWLCSPAGGESRLRSWRGPAGSDCC
jgi:hypothetical protein